jgi:two-component system phosphate regulon sensor histidine kinase PhoR
LSIVQHIVEEHHGTIRFQSKEGEGTTFEIQLPVAIENK